jgi:hypothetical protein
MGDVYGDYPAAPVVGKPRLDISRQSKLITAPARWLGVWYSCS